MTFPFTEHPCLPPVTREQILAIVDKHGGRAPEVLAAVERKRVETIELAEREPLTKGWVFPHWKDALEELQSGLLLLALFGGNGAGKTWFAVWEAMRTMFAEPGSKCLFLHESEQSSIEVHHAIAYHFLPPHLKPVDGYKVKKSVTTQIGYDSKNGFVGNAFSLPNGSKAVFGHYTQRVKLYEGTGWKRIVADEDMPLSWLDTLLVRLPRAKGQMIWCFTAIDGVTPAIASVAKGARTLKHRPVDPDLLPADHRVDDAQDFPAGTMPYLQESTRPQTRIMYFHTDLNPLPPGQYETMKRIAASKDLIWRERRLYGWARNTMRAVFPRFGRAHILPAEKMRQILARPCTRFQVLDPAGNRNFFLIWFAVDSEGRHFIYREWPDVPHFGEWALPSDDKAHWDGRPGPAQISLGYGVIDYKRVILEAEGWEKVDGVWQKRAQCEDLWQRFIDPRSGAVAAVAEDTGDSSLIDRFRDEQRDSAGRLVGPSLDFEPAYTGRTEDDGLTLLNEMLSYDTTQPITALVNEPKLYVSEECENVIWALSNYTQHDGPKAACKDPVDCTRYMALKECMHVHSAMLSGIRGGGYA